MKEQQEITVVQTKFQPKPVTLEPKRADGRPFMGNAVVRVEPTTIGVGGSFSLECEAHCQGGIEFLNPFLSEEYHLPAKVIITSADGAFRQELLHTGEVRRDRPATQQLTFGSQSGVGRRLTVHVGKQPGQEAGPSSGDRFLDLSPGEYYIQAIYEYSLIASRSNPYVSELPRTPETERKDADGKPPVAPEFPTHPLLVSEPVKLVVTSSAEPSAGEAARDPCPLHVEIRPAQTQAVALARTEIEIRFRNQSDKTIVVYNPLLSALLLGWNRAVVLAVLREDGSYIGDLLYRSGGSSVSPNGSDWVHVPPGGIMATKHRFTAGIIQGTRHFNKSNPLPPGKYFLELRIHQYVLSPPPAFAATSDLNHPSYREWMINFPGPEIYRSERAELTILAPKDD